MKKMLIVSILIKNKILANKIRMITEQLLKVKVSAYDNCR